MSKLEHRLGSPTVDWQRAALQVALCAIPLLLLSLSLWGRQNKARRVAVPPRLQKAIGCLAVADYIQQFGLKPIGLKIGDLVWVQYEIGSIPGIGGTPRLWNVAIYSQSGRRGTLLFAYPNQQGGFEAVRNGYDLVKDDSHWVASGGQGGSRLYEAVGRYVTALSRRPRYRVKLLPGGSECTREQIR